MQDLIVKTKAEKDKGRSFRASILSFLTADFLWPGGEAETNNIRPIWAMFAGSDNQLKAFMANLTMGRKAETYSIGYSSRSVDRYEFLKTAGYRVSYQKVASTGSIATIFLPDLFRIDPGLVDPQGIKFVLLPSKKWVASQKVEGTPILKHIRDLGYDRWIPAEGISAEELAVVAHLFATYLDRRTRCPLVSDGRFFLQLLLSCLHHRMMYMDLRGSYSQYKRYNEDSVADVGLLPGMAFSASHTDFEELAAREVSAYFAAIKG